MIWGFLLSREIKMSKISKNDLCCLTTHHSTNWFGHKELAITKLFFLVSILILSSHTWSSVFFSRPFSFHWCNLSILFHTYHEFLALVVFVSLNKLTCVWFHDKIGVCQCVYFVIVLNICASFPILLPNKWLHT